MNRKLIEDNAKAFRIAGDRCFEERAIDIKTIQFIPVPGIVNYVFAIELYLKCLLISIGKFKRTHELKLLFYSVNSGQQEEIIEGSTYDLEEFKKLLEQHSNVFVNWRYLHEQESASVNPDFVKRFLFSLEKSVKRINQV